MGEQRGLAPLLTVDLAPVTVELNLRESGARFPCKWSSVLEIYTATELYAGNGTLLQNDRGTSDEADRYAFRHLPDTSDRLLRGVHKDTAI